MQPYGIVVSLERPYLGCSPDGLIGDDALIKVKCPFAARHKHITVETVDYLYLDDQTGLLSLKTDHDYYSQVQGQLYVTDRKMCFFVVYTLCDCLVIEVKRNDTFICKLNDQLDAFFSHSFRACTFGKKFLQELLCSRIL